MLELKVNLKLHGNCGKFPNSLCPCTNNSTGWDAPVSIPFMGNCLDVINRGHKTLTSLNIAKNDKDSNNVSTRPQYKFACLNQ